MSTQTTNLHLTKPAGNERPDVDVINANMDIIDSAIGAFTDIGVPAAVSYSGWKAIGSGMHYFTNAETSTYGLPRGGLLVQMQSLTSNDDVFFQMLYCTDELYFRRFGGSAIGNWYKIAGTLVS